MTIPRCDNCDYFDAVVECAVCQEYYCQECFESVHFGGKRKRHKFRALCDFYGNRIDYGDGEFPSKWPSEVQQDEEQGWIARDMSDAEMEEMQAKLAKGERINPNWKRYHDDDSAADFFYNEKTGVSQYERPDSFRTAGMPTAREGQEALEVGDGDWAKYFDDASGLEFFYNATTGESTYDRPLEFRTPRPAAGQQAVEVGANSWKKYYDEASGTDFYFNEATAESMWERPIEFQTPRPAANQVPVEGGDGGWDRYYDDGVGRFYFYNSITGESQYQRPARFLTPRPQKNEQALETGQAGWEKYWDEENQLEYYYHVESGESTYDRPPEYATPRQ